MTRRFADAVIGLLKSWSMDGMAAFDRHDGNLGVRRSLDKKRRLPSRIESDSPCLNATRWGFWALTVRVP